jgi:hypothetical protein
MQAKELITWDNSPTLISIVELYLQGKEIFDASDPKDDRNVQQFFE